MSGFYTPDGRFLATENGRPVVGAKLFVYLAGTTTPTPSYKDTAMTIPNTNPVIMDSQGRAVIVLDPANAYDFLLQRPDGSTLSAQINIVLPPSNTQLAAVSASVTAEHAAMLAAVAAEAAARISNDNDLQAQITNQPWFEISGTMNAITAGVPADRIFKSGTSYPFTSQYNAATGEFTATTGGKWRFEGYVSLQIVTADGYIETWAEINGVRSRDLMRLTNQGSSTLSERRSFSVSFNLSAGDVVRFSGYSIGTSGATQAEGLWLRAIRMS